MIFKNEVNLIIDHNQKKDWINVLWVKRFAQLTYIIQI